MKKHNGHRKPLSVKDQDLFARLLVRKLDHVFQRYFHQSMTEIATDFRIHASLRRLPPSPHQLLQLIHSSQILKMRSAPAIAQAAEALDRYFNKTFGVCSRCGRQIPPELLEIDLMTTTCPECQHEPTSRIYSLTTTRQIVPEGHDT